MSAPGVPTHEIEMRVRVRLGRRDTITRREPVPFVGLIGEAALRQQIGSRDVMLEQLQWLLELGNGPLLICG